MTKSSRLKTIIASTAIVATCFVAAGARAGSVTQPGETVGVGIGAPLPEGVYFVNTASTGERGGANEAVNIPVIAWSTPLVVAGGRIEALLALPELYVGSHSGKSFSQGLYNPFVAGMIAWDLGDGLGVSYLAGGYIPQKGGDFANAFDQGTFRQDVHVSYNVGAWSANANLIYGIVGDNNATHAQNPNYFNYDLSLTRTGGKVSFGPVVFGSTDVQSPAGHLAQSQTAIGGLVGYNFGPVIAQAYVTTDVVQSNYGGKETRFWLRFTVPM